METIRRSSIGFISLRKKLDEGLLRGGVGTCRWEKSQPAMTTFWSTSKGERSAISCVIFGRGPAQIHQFYRYTMLQTQPHTVMGL